MEQVRILLGDFTTLSADDPANGTGLPVCIINTLKKAVWVDVDKAEFIAEFMIGELKEYDSYVIPKLFEGSVVYGKPSQLMMDNADVLSKVLAAINLLEEHIDGETMDYIIGQLKFDQYLSHRYTNSVQAYMLIVSENEDLAEKGEEIPEMSDERFKELAEDPNRGMVVTLSQLEDYWNNEAYNADTYIRIL